MKRREWLHQVGVGSAALVTGGGALASVAASAAQGHAHTQMDGPLATATVSFGQWPVGTAAAPIDRMAIPFAPQAPNGHLLIPRTPTIKAGGTVNYVIAGFHQIAVYAPGTRPDQIDTSSGLPIPDAPPFIFLIDDPANRLYRGPDPRVNPADQDRVEAITFHSPGQYLVICTVSIHFLNDAMYGWVRVLS
jgi:plastocyanin